MSVTTDAIAVTHKYTGETIGHVPLASAGAVHAAVRTARQALAHPLAPLQRYEILLRAAHLIQERAEQLALLIAREAGKPLKDARAEASRAVQTFTLSAEEAKRIGGEVVPIEASAGNENRLAFTIRVPVGVVAAIAPFNFPLNLVAHKVAPALAAGNAVVLKPATTTPLSAVELCRVLADAGLPAGFLNLVVGPGSTVGEALLDDPDVDFYTFTGSPPVGRRIKERTGLRRVTLELGNNSPNIVAADSDIEAAAELLSRRAYGSAGQFCISVQRIYVEEPVADRFRELFLNTTKSLVVGDPEDERTDVGPMITQGEAERAEAWIQEAVSQGARVVCGGHREGPVLQPTLLENVSPEMRVVCQEVFAPVASLVTVRSFDEAVERANDTAYGLQAGVFTRDLGRVIDAARRLRFGGVIFNDTSGFRADLMPYGGLGESGMGREGPRYAVEEMTELRTVVLRG